ncbi:MAG: secretin N-terminal domain-containing protein [Candidatus Zhuqueibacterota bacterium]
MPKSDCTIYNIRHVRVAALAFIVAILLTACSHQATNSRRSTALEESYSLTSQAVNKRIDKENNIQADDPFDDLKVTMTFNNARLTDVLRIVAREFKANLAIPSDENSKVTVALQNANLYEALAMILSATDYAYVKKGQVFVIKKNTEKISSVYALKFVKAGSIAEILAGITETAKISADELTNSLLVTDEIVNMATFDEIIDELDKFQPAVLIEADIFEISLENLRTLGIEWGIHYFQDPNAMGAASPKALSAEGLVFSYSNLKAPQIELMLRALRGSSYSELLSKPRIVTLNGEEAKMLVGERVPYVKASTATATGNVLQEVEFVDVGILLKVTPRIIAEENMVIIDVQPEVSEVLDKTIQGVPRIGTREAKTRVAVKNGETVIIGGLIKKDKLWADSGTPLLEKIPLINLFFKNRTDSKSERELIVFITPHILTKEHYDIMKVEHKSAKSTHDNR